jgi:hypothetical protein
MNIDDSSMQEEEHHDRGRLPCYSFNLGIWGNATFCSALPPETVFVSFRDWPNAFLLCGYSLPKKGTVDAFPRIDVRLLSLDL